MLMVGRRMFVIGYRKRSNYEITPSNGKTNTLNSYTMLSYVIRSYWKWIRTYVCVYVKRGRKTLAFWFSLRNLRSTSMKLFWNPKHLTIFTTGKNHLFGLNYVILFILTKKMPFDVAHLRVNIADSDRRHRRISILLLLRNSTSDIATSGSILIFR